VTLRVLHVLEAVEGGVARHVTDIVRHVDAEHTVVLPPERVGGFTDTTAAETMEKCGAAIQFLAMRRAPADPRNASALGRVRRLIRVTRPHIVHGHSSIGGAVARLAATGTGTARVYTPNGLLPARGALMAERLLGRVTDRFVAVSETEAELARRLRLARPDHVSVIPNGIDLDDPGPPPLDVRGELGIDGKTPLVGTISRLVPQKAPDVLINAWARVTTSAPDARFVLVGDGPLAAQVDSQVTALGLGDRLLHLRGIHGAASLMPQLDAFVLASRYEGAPYAALEAMRAETAVVLTDVVGNRDLVVDGESGLLVSPGDPGALAAAIVRVLGDAELRRRLARSGRARLIDQFDVRVMATRVAALYGSL
jgi:glycosyltransferase involved in cell wall biosynthesis